MLRQRPLGRRGTGGQGIMMFPHRQAGATQKNGLPQWQAVAYIHVEVNAN